MNSVYATRSLWNTLTVYGVNSNEILVSFDIVCLFTFVPVDKAVDLF